MSDISIPGVPGTSRFDTDKMIEELMKVERAGVDRMNGELEATKTEKDAWQSVNRNLSQVRDSARSLFGFENPFNERISTSSDESILTATASRDASLENAKLQVIKLAGRDRFLSRAVSEDFEVPTGTYTIGVGDKEVSFTFRGGDLQDLEEIINTRSKGLVSARVVRNSASTQVILIESQKAGAKNTLSFSDQALIFAERAGILKTSDTAARQFPLDGLSFRRLDVPLSEAGIQFSAGSALFPPGAEAALPVTPAVVPKDNLQLEIVYEVKVIPYEYTPPTPPPGPDTPDAGLLLYEGIEISNQPSKILVPEWNPEPPPEKRDDTAVFFVKGGSNEFPLPRITDSDGRQTIRVTVRDYLDTLDAIHIRNSNTNREVTVHSIRVYDPESRGDFTPTNAVETASDATLSFEGIEVTRETNAIDDLIPGVTLNLKKSSDEPVELNVTHDTEAVKNGIIEFVGYYDKLISELAILTGRSEDVIEEITYLTDDERQSAYERLGLLQGDITVMQLKSRLQTILMNPYTTSLGRELALLDQIGISTNAVGSRSGAVNRSRLRGYLEINEKALDEALDANLPAIEELFGQDTDGDLIVDSGVGFTLDAYIKPYVETGGLVSARLDTLDGRIARTSSRIETEQEKLQKKEQGYRRQFATMEGALTTLEQSSAQIDNFNKNNSSQ